MRYGRFVGVSENGDLMEATLDAITQAKNGLHTDFLTWSLDGIGGEDGGFIGVKRLFVTIRAESFIGPDPSVALTEHVPNVRLYSIRTNENPLGYLFEGGGPDSRKYFKGNLKGGETPPIGATGRIEAEDRQFKFFWDLDPFGRGKEADFDRI